jgi:hypothetical protein
MAGVVRSLASTQGRSDLPTLPSDTAVTVRASALYSSTSGGGCQRRWGQVGAAPQMHRNVRHGQRLRVGGEAEADDLPLFRPCLGGTGLDVQLVNDGCRPLSCAAVGVVVPGGGPPPSCAGGTPSAFRPSPIPRSGEPLVHDATFPDTRGCSCQGPVGPLVVRAAP